MARKVEIDCGVEVGCSLSKRGARAFNIAVKIQAERIRSGFFSGPEDTKE